MARILWGTLAVVGLVVLDVAALAQQGSSTSGTPGSAPSLAGLRRHMKQLRELQVQELAGEIGPPPGNCRVDVSYIEGDALGEGLAEFVADVFNRAYWKVAALPVEPLASATPGILIQFSPPAATAAAKLQATLNQREGTDISSVWVGDPQRCTLNVTVGPQ